MINEGQALQATIPLEQYVDGADHELRVELYLNKDNTGNAGDFSCVIGKYVDYVVHPVEFVKAEDIAIQYPDQWPSVDFSSGVTEPLHLYAGWSENVITADDYTVTGEKTGDWYTSDVVIRPAGGYEVIWDGEKWDTSYTVKEGEGQDVTFKLGKMVDGKIVETTFLHDPLVLSVDTSDPTGQITIGENFWTKFLHTITFGLFFNETVDVKITAADSMSGVQPVEYVKAEAALTQEELAEAEWIEGDSFSVEPDDTFVVYARITDNTGRTILLSSDGIVADASKPVIAITYAHEGEWTTDSGAAVEVEVSDSLSGIESITYTVDGKAYSTEQTAFRIADLPDGDYEVVVTVTDKAGNTAAEMVHVKKGTPPGVGGEEPEPSPETGDRGIPAPVLALLVSSGGTLIATGAVARRRKKRSGI